MQTLVQSESSILMCIYNKYNVYFIKIECIIKKINKYRYIKQTIYSSAEYLFSLIYNVSIIKLTFFSLHCLRLS